MTLPTIRVVGPGEVRERHREFAAFERAFVYPLGEDRFHIDHGSDYLAFFRRLGAPEMFVAESDGRIVGALVAVLRRMGNHEAWYLGDLKAHCGARRLLLAFAARHLRSEVAAHAVSMNPAGRPNRLVAAARRCRAAAPLRSHELAFFTFDRAAWLDVESMLTANLGSIRFFDNRGTKDIVLASTGAPMPLLHAQHGPLAQAGGAPRDGAIHMLCLPAEHPATRRLTARGVGATATATALFRHMDWFDPTALLTSDI